jgi:hypothetical protein
MAKFEIWLVPVPPEGNFLYMEAHKVGEADNRDDAEMDRYLYDCDDPSPDKHNFRRIEIREIS